MSPVTWEVFEGSRGAADYNFEMVCRILIRRHYGRYGYFSALANQPGVEFHLRLHTDCLLGEAGRWYGWQCRWYDLPRARNIGNTRRGIIEKAIRTTEKHLPDLTDWVLWTKYPLTRSDQTWFYNLETQMQLHLWNEAELEEHFGGPGEIVRGSYFGELVLNPEDLLDLHEVRTAPILHRWQPEVHQTLESERVIRQMLGEKSSWDDLPELASRLQSVASDMDNEIRTLPKSIVEEYGEATRLIHIIAKVLTETFTILSQGNIDLLQQDPLNRPDAPYKSLDALTRKLRAHSHPIALKATNALADLRNAYILLEQIEEYLGISLIAVVAAAGYGKTQLAAQLTMAVGTRPCGVLLHGRDLHRGQNLDNLAASQVVIQGAPVSSMEALIAAVNAAGQRSKSRLPIAIDGLNEAEDPREWRNLLSSLNEIVRIYPFVLVVCTLRPEFIVEALPQNTRRIEIPGFGEDVIEAIRRYFTHYQINPTDAELPIGMLNHPLTLRLFCEVTNPKREKEVGIEAMPGSLSALFIRYLELASERIMELAPINHRFYLHDIRKAIGEIGIALLEERSRNLHEPTLRVRLNDTDRPWNESIVRALEQEGVVLRSGVDASGDMNITAIYDALAGHLIADSILRQRGQDAFEEWLSNPETINMLNGPFQERHPLAKDIFDALVGLTPRILHSQQLWQLLEEPMRSMALNRAAHLEVDYLDGETVRELAALIPQQTPIGSRELLERLWRTRSGINHPLNAEFLDKVLREMSVAERDLRWTEWVRRNRNEILTDLRRLEERWGRTRDRSGIDLLRAKWVMWNLTSTVRNLRDQASRSLYWFGRGKPSDLYALTIAALDINDPYVSERLLAVSYGVTMAHQIPNPVFAEALQGFLVELQDAFTGPSSTQPTNHWLFRLYVQGIITFAEKYYSEIVPEGLIVDGRIQFSPGQEIIPIVDDDPRSEEIDKILHMDFENYTLGRLFDDRANYDMDHQGHKAAVGYVRGTAWALGWRENEFGGVDKELNFYRHRGDRQRIERYGKKYSWIGYYSYAGTLVDAGLLPYEERLSEVQIDPSFPEPSKRAPFSMPTWTRQTPVDNERWICKGIVRVPDNVLYRANIGSHQGPWIAVRGNMNCQNEVLGRRVFGILTAFLVSSQDTDEFIRTINGLDHPGGLWLNQVPGDYYTFAGEIPWNPTFALSDTDGDLEQLYNISLRVNDEISFGAETLAHRYSWEDYHSDLNQAGGALVPSRLFSASFDLRGIPQTFNQTLLDGTVAALSQSAPDGFDGELLYLREDLVHRYSNGRRLIWLNWGERLLYPYPTKLPDWYLDARRRRLDVWRSIHRGAELSDLFST